LIDKRWFFVGALVVGVFLFVILLVPFFVNADAFRPAIETQLTNALGRNVSMGKLSFSLMQASLIAEDLVIQDDPAFSDVPFMQAKALATGIKIFPFLFQRQVQITNLTIDTPSIQLIEHPDGKWNYSSLGDKTSNVSIAGTDPVSALTVGELKVVNGSALISSVPATATPFDYTDVNFTLKHFSFLKSFPFELSAKLPGGAAVKLTGEAGPISPKNAARTPFQATLQIREFNPVSAGIIEPTKGISMNNDIDAEIKSDGSNVVSTGKIKASQLQLVPKGSPAQEVVDVDYSISQNFATREGTVSDVAIHAGSAAAHVQGSFKPSPEGMMLNLHLSVPSLPLDDLGRLFPAVGITLPKGASLQGGTLTAKIAIIGSATSAALSGPIEIDSTTLSGFDLASNIDGLGSFSSTRNGTDIRLLKANVSSNPQGTRLSDIYGEMPQIGTASGVGTVAPSGEIEFRLIAKVYGLNTAGSPASQATITASGSLQPNAKPTQGPTRVISLAITGTAASPSIRANSGAPTR
jgi:AsmA protein